MSEAVTETFEQKLRRAFTAIAGVKIPDIPEALLALDKEMRSRYPNTAVMADIISHNTMLAAEVLKLVNAPAMRPKQTVTSIPQAVSIMGTDNLRNMLISAAMKQLFSTPEDVAEIMDHSADVAYCAAELANHVHGITPDEAYLCGLFHNCGAMLLVSKFHKPYSELFFQSHSIPLTVMAKEEALCNTNHTAVGLLMAKKWQIDEAMVQAIFYHHVPRAQKIPNDRVRLFVGLLKVANGIVSEVSLGAYIGQEMNDYLMDGLDTLMLDASHVKAVRMALQTYSAQ